MTILVPLTIRVGNEMVTNQVQDVQWRKEAIGGTKSITFTLPRTIEFLQDNLAPYTKAWVSDARSGELLAEGRIADPGMMADSNGEQWKVTCFGPSQHVNDITTPYVVVDSTFQNWDLDSEWTEEGCNITLKQNSAGVEGVRFAPDQAMTVTTAWQGEIRYPVLDEIGGQLARIEVQHLSGVTNANYVLIIGTNTSQGSAALAVSTTADVAGGTLTAVITTNFTAGDDVAVVRFVRNTSSVTAAPTHWMRVHHPVIRTRLVDKSGNYVTSYTSNTVTSNLIVADMLKSTLNSAGVAILGRFDVEGLMGGSIATTTNAIEQFCYVDPVDGEQLLDDLMALEPGYRWYATFSDPITNRYAFYWEAWPTANRYEATLEDGGEFPLSTQELYNKVVVRWRDRKGRVRSTVRTQTIDTLSNASVTRQAILDLGDEVGATLAQAQTAGDNFLADHSVPLNSGTLNVARPIWDYQQCRYVEPWEIEPGELILVRGVESKGNTFNDATDNDGVSVFRIVAMDYTASTNTARLELDTYSRTTANALRKIARKRKRRR